jgi:beta-lactamase regulating signal transducer with metallopeptidase domain
MDTLLHAGLSNVLMAAVLALPAAAVARLGRRPALAHALWLLVLLKLLTPPLIPVPILGPGGEPEAGDQIAADTRPGPPAGAAGPLAGDLLGVALPAVAEAPGELAPALAIGEPAPDCAAADSRWRAILVTVWLGVSALWFVWAALQVRRFRRLLRHARLAPAAMQDAARTLAARLGRGRPPAVWLVPGAVSPMLWALGRAPRLLFPAGLLEGLGPGQRDALLAHELAHWRRRDHWVRLVEVAAFGLYWWCPLVWWARHELHEAEEQCCDAWAVWALDGDGRTYALALLETVSFLSQARPALPVGASGVGQVRHLRRRLTMVLRGKTYRSLSWLGAAAVFSLGLLLLPLLPVGAQDAPTTARAQARPAAKDDRQRQIEALRELLRALEAQAQPEKQRVRVRLDGARTRPENAELAQARARVKALQAQAKAQFKQAVKDLAKLEGRGDARPEPKSAPRTDRAPKREPTPRPNVNPPDTTPAPRPKTETDVRRKAVEALSRFGQRPPPSGTLEQRLERLLREVEELRRELRGRGQPNSTAPPRDSGKAPAPETKAP